MKTNSLNVSKINLSLEEQVELGKRMTVFGDQEARDALILNCVPVVTEAAKHFSHHALASYDDLFQEGMMGVMEAIDKYDYTRNVKFTSFAYYRIIHNLALWTKKQFRLRSPHTNVKATDGIILDSTIDTFQAIYRTQPTDSQLTKLLSMSDGEVLQLKRRHVNPVPSAYRICSFDTMSDFFGNTVDAAYVVERLMCKEYNHMHLHNAIQQLDGLEQDIVVRRHLYGGEKKKATLMEIAKEHNINASTVLRRERKALRKILQYFKDNDIQPEL